MPTWRDLGIQPFSTSAREHETWAPTFLATDSATSMSDLSRTPSPSEIRMRASFMSAPRSAPASSEIMSFMAEPSYCQ